MADNNFYKTLVLPIQQGAAPFYVAALPVELLLQVTGSDRAKAVWDEKRGYKLLGNQRFINDDRLDEIARYIQREDANFPNSIILAANKDPETDLHPDELIDEKGDAHTVYFKKTEAWRIEEDKKSGQHTLIIPTDSRIAAIVDGQHRLFAFAKAKPDSWRGMKLVCSIFLDLPKAYQAQIFAIINSTQKRVDRSLTYELFGYSIEDEEENLWTPDKLAVHLSRKLSTDDKSPLRGKIVIWPKLDKSLQEISKLDDWRVSTSVVVDGILRLISSNPKRDSDDMKEKGEAKTRDILPRPTRKDAPPLRNVYIDGNDALLYNMVLNYLIACQSVFWRSFSKNSMIFKTVGIQALFDILRHLAKQAYEDKYDKDGKGVEYFTEKLKPAEKLNFSRDYLRNYSGVGRGNIRHEIGVAMGLWKRKKK